jgi:hypothetical protein
MAVYLRSRRSTLPSRTTDHPSRTPPRAIFPYVHWTNSFSHRIDTRVYHISLSPFRHSTPRHPARLQSHPTITTRGCDGLIRVGICLFIVLRGLRMPSLFFNFFLLCRSLIKRCCCAVLYADLPSCNIAMTRYLHGFLTNVAILDMWPLRLKTIAFFVLLYPLLVFGAWVAIEY